MHNEYLSEIEISNHFIPARRSSKLGWYEKFREQIFLLNDWPSNILLIGDSLKAHQRIISKKRCFEKYCSCDQACQFSASYGRP